MKPTIDLSIQSTHIHKTPRSRHPLPARPSRSKLRGQRWNLDLSCLLCGESRGDRDDGSGIIVITVDGLVPSLCSSLRLRFRPKLRLSLRPGRRLPSRPRSNLPLPPSFQHRCRRRIPVKLLDLVYDHLFRLLLLLFLLFLVLPSAVFFCKSRGFVNGLSGVERLMFPSRSNLRLRSRLGLGLRIGVGFDLGVRVGFGDLNAFVLDVGRFAASLFRRSNSETVKRKANNT
jgi:hypothetical protein